MTNEAPLNLITTWLDYELASSPGRRLTDVKNDINEALKRSYTLSRIREWQRGTRAPDSIAHNYILLRVLPHALDNDPDSDSPPSIESLRTSFALPVTTSGT